MITHERLADRACRLDPRMKDIARLIAMGRTDKQIGHQLGGLAITAQRVGQIIDEMGVLLEIDPAGRPREQIACAAGCAQLLKDIVRQARTTQEVGDMGIENQSRGIALADEPTQLGMSFGVAIKELQNGSAVQRTGWNGPGQYLKLQVPDANSFMTKPYIYISTVQGDRIPWLASQSDMLARDWRLVNPAP